VFSFQLSVVGLPGVDLGAAAGGAGVSAAGEHRLEGVGDAADEGEEVLDLLE
jgi:hypothetical protein